MLIPKNLSLLTLRLNLELNYLVSLKLPTPKDIRHLRKIAKLTQKELAKKAGVSQSLIARIEKGTVDPRLSTLKRIFDAVVTVFEKRSAKDVMHSPVITIDAMEPVYKVIRLMRKQGISQLPITKNGKIVGSIQESTLIDKILFISKKRNIVYEQVQNIMEDRFTMVRPSSNFEDVLVILSRGHPAVLVTDKDKIVGIITKIDVLSSTIH